MIKFSVEYKIDGRSVSGDQFAESAHRKVIDHLKSTIKTKVESVQCPEHHVRARLRDQTPSGTTMKLAVEGCCDKLAQMTQTALR